MSHTPTYLFSRSDVRQAVEEQSHAHATHRVDSLRGPAHTTAMRSGGTAPVVQGLFEQPCACKFAGCKCTVRTTQDICVMCSKGHHDL